MGVRTAQPEARAMLAFIASLLALLSAAPPLPARDDARYWAFADRMQARLDPLWDERAGRYQPGTGGVETTFNGQRRGWGGRHEWSAAPAAPVAAGRVRQAQAPCGGAGQPRHLLAP
jgi:hypothetical protein